MPYKASDLNLTFDWYRAVKASADCLVCGDKPEDKLLHFHHVDPKTKTAAVAQLARADATICRLQIEMRKCVTVCLDCHDDIHAGHIKGWLKGRFNDGSKSHDRIAREYLPFRPFKTRYGILTPVDPNGGVIALAA